MSNFDTVLLNGFLAPDSVALYKAAQMVLIGVISLAPISFPMIFTFFVELEAKGNRADQGRAYFQATKYGLAFFIPISMMMFVLAGEIIGLLYPNTYAPAADALRIFALAPCFYFLYNVNTSSLLGRGEVKEACKFILLAGVASVLLNVLLIPHFGFKGSAMAYAGACILPALLALPVMVRKLAMPIELGVLVKPVAISALAAAAVVAARWLFLSNEIALIALFPIACAALYLLALDKDDRRLLSALGSLLRTEKAIINWRRKERNR